MSASIVPKRSVAAATIAAAPSGVVTESWLATARPPAAVIAATASSARSPNTSLITTDAPSRARCSP